MGCGASRHASVECDSTITIEVAPGGHASPRALELLEKHRQKNSAGSGCLGNPLEADLDQEALQKPGSPVLAAPRRRRISAVIGEFADTLQGYLENRDHPFLGEDRLRRLFQLIDADQSGTLSTAEVQAFWKKMGWFYSPNSIKTMFQLADKDGSGGIDYQEFATFFRKLGGVDELRPDPENDEWVRPQDRMKRKVRPRGRVWPAGTRPLVSYTQRFHLGQPSRVKCLAVDSSRPMYVACSRGDPCLKLYDLKTGALDRHFSSHNDTIVCVALSPDKKFLATGSRDGLMILWDSVSGIVVEQMDHPAVVSSVAFSPYDGRFIVSGCQDSICRKWGSAKGRLLVQSEKLGRGVCVSAVYTDKVIAVSLSREKSVQLLDTRTLRCRWVLRGFSTMVWTVTASVDFRHLLTVCEQFVKVWDTQSLRLRHCMPVDSRVEGAKALADFTATESNELSKSSSLSKSDSLVLETEGGWAKPQRDSRVRSSRWITACFLPGDFSHILCASCSDEHLYFVQSNTGVPVLSIAMRSPVYCLSSTAEDNVLCTGDEIGNICVISFR
eukprot:TRINITY_DN8456_c0_g4_i1.p1 TRINITY_DN8456_c0_g4~~TRINITY_DN8456_c0_g4_i1.p1  ORF type:complete len:555 (+),score=69.11 TRINITY_DN8456_c0_g4_i1:331-1995(+)